jgi:hypothetical protein
MQGLHQKNNGLARWPSGWWPAVHKVEFSSALRESDLFLEPIDLAVSELFDVGRDHAIKISRKLTKESLWRSS